MATSFNGFTVLMDYPGTAGRFYSPAPGFHEVYVRNRPFAVLFEAVTRRWHRDIEPIAAQDPDNWKKPRERYTKNREGEPTLIGVHGYREPGTSVGTGDQSNHRSGTCIDNNGHLHPYEATMSGPWYSGFTASQERALRKIKSDFTTASGKVILRLGLDFAVGKRDGMHVEVDGATQADVNSAAKKLESYVGRSSTANVWFRNAKGLDVKAIQSQLTAKGFDAKGVDGYAGADTDAAIRAFQKAAGITVDGRVGNGTRAALASYTKPTPKPDPKPDPKPEPTPEPEPDYDEWTISGSNRYATAAAAALIAYPNGSGAVYLVGGESYSDQTSTASFTDGPLLLVRDGRDALPPETAKAIRTLGPTTVYRVGGQVTDAAMTQARYEAGLA